MAVSRESRGGSPRVAVLLAADASSWEQAALAAVAGAGPSLVLVKRCLDLEDLLGSAASGTAHVAVVADGLSGLDADSMAALGRHGVRTVVVIDDSRRTGNPEESIGLRARLLRMGAARVLDAAAAATLAEHVREAAAAQPGPAGAGVADDPLAEAGLEELAPAVERHGRLLAVWGATGAPGRTTVALAVAAEAAARGLHVTLLDADPYGGAAGQHLAVLEEVSGLLATTRLANTGQLDSDRLAQLAREVTPGLRLVSGLPRPDRWTEVRPQAFATLLSTARSLDDLVVVDTGFGLPSTATDPFSTAPGRDDTTLAALMEADVVLVVASADPVGLTRLARSLRELDELGPDGAVHVVVNRMRPSLGWSEREVADLVSRVLPGAALSFLPDDRAAADRALVAGRTLVECGDSALRRAVAALVDSLSVVTRSGAPAGAPRRRRGRGAFRRQTVSSR
jgi:MinD-like ATPase involved in chromosome partitioning or flagellar assembly